MKKKIEHKPNIIQGHISQKVRFSTRGILYRLYFAVFCQQREQKGRFQTEFEQKPRIEQRLFSQNIMFFMHGAWSKRRFYS